MRICAAAVMSRTKPFRVDDVSKIVTQETLEEAYGIPVKVASIEVPEHPDGRVTTCVPLLKTKANPCPCAADGFEANAVDGRVRRSA